jgi:enamine deaminase RidA (YjgF/YER057c/UK114 family)
MIKRSIPDVGYLGTDVHEAFGFAQVVRTGPFVHLAGIAPLSGSLSTLKLVGEGSAYQQLEFVLKVMRDLLASEGLGVEALASWTVYCTDVHAVLEVMPKLITPFVGEHRPASTLVGVSALFLPGQLVEIAALAYAG